MQPREESRLGRSLPGALANPAHRARHDFLRPPLVRAALHEVVIEPIEPAADAGAGVERVSADERSRRVAGGRKRLGECGGLRWQPKAVVGANAMARRVEPGENRRVRGQRQRHLRNGVLEDERASGGSRQAIDAWREPARRTEEAHAVRAQRIDGDEHHGAFVTKRRRSRRVSRRPAGHEEHAQRECASTRLNSEHERKIAPERPAAANA